MSLTAIVLFFITASLFFFDINKTFKELKSKTWKVILIILTIGSFTFGFIDQYHHSEYENKLALKQDSITYLQKTTQKQTDSIRIQADTITAKTDTILVHQSRQNVLSELSNQIAARELSLRIKEDSINMLKDEAKFFPTCNLIMTDQTIAFNFRFYNVGKHSASNISTLGYVSNNNATYFRGGEPFYYPYDIPAGKSFTYTTENIERKYFKNNIMFISITIRYTDELSKTRDSFLVTGDYNGDSNDRQLTLLTGPQAMKINRIIDSLAAIKKNKIP